MTKRALITGITGQDGSYLAELLLDEGYEVIGMVRRSSTVTFERIAHLQDRIATVPGDLLDQASLIDLLRTHRPDEVYNLAAQSFVPTSWDQPVLTGEFTALGNQSRYAIGRLNTNGLLDTTFNASVFDPPPAPPIPSHRVQAILMQPDGRLVVGGRTTTQLQNGQTSTVGFVRRLNTNGALDGTFTIVGEIDGPVNTLAVQADGNILVGGQFATFAGQPRARIARASARPSAPGIGFSPAA